jgi:hypothetical protein
LKYVDIYLRKRREGRSKVFYMDVVNNCQQAAVGNPQDYTLPCPQKLKP